MPAPTQPSASAESADSLRPVDNAPTVPDLFAFPCILDTILSFSNAATLNTFLRVSRTGCRFAAKHLYQHVEYHPGRHNPFYGVPITASIAVAGTGDDSQAPASQLTLTATKYSSAGSNGRATRTIPNPLALFAHTRCITMHPHCYKDHQDRPTPPAAPTLKTPFRLRDRILLRFVIDTSVDDRCPDPTYCIALKGLRFDCPSIVHTFERSQEGPAVHSAILEGLSQPIRSGIYTQINLQPTERFFERPKGSKNLQGVFVFMPIQETVRAFHRHVPSDIADFAYRRCTRLTIVGAVTPFPLKSISQMPRQPISRRIVRGENGASQSGDAGSSHEMTIAYLSFADYILSDCRVSGTRIFEGDEWDKWYKWAQEQKQVEKAAEQLKDGSNALGAGISAVE